MAYYALRTNDQSVISTILNSNIGTQLQFGNLSWYLNKIALNDICFIKISGDDAAKQITYDNSLVAIVKIISTPYNIHIPANKKTNHGTIDIEIIQIFQNITANELYKYPTLKNTLSIGASTKGMPNQAIGRLSKGQAEDIIKALINENRLNNTFLASMNITNRNLDILTQSTIIV